MFNAGGIANGGAAAAGGAAVVTTTAGATGATGATEAAGGGTGASQSLDQAGAVVPIVNDVAAAVLPATGAFSTAGLAGAAVLLIVGGLVMGMWSSRRRAPSE